jgi:hypothetical protein
MSAAQEALPIMEIDLNRDLFMRTLIRELSGTLEEVVGIREAAGFVSVVGRNMGESIDRQYKTALGVTQLTPQQIGAVMVDLKKRIDGDFYILEQTEDKIVLGNRACPFGDKVLGRPSMCMMTSNVFGFIAAENMGYSKVALEQTIAQGHPGCRVTVYLKPTPEALETEGREYFQG